MEVDSLVGESADDSSNDGTSDAGSSPQSSYTGPPAYNWGGRYSGGGGRVGQNTGMGPTQRRSSSYGGQGAMVGSKGQGYDV